MASARRPLVIEYYSAFPRMQIGPTAVGIPDRNNLQNARLRGGAGRTRTNHQSVMEHGSSPTNSPGRTPMQIAGRFAVLLDFPGFLILESTARVLWNIFESDQLPWSDTHPDRRAIVVFRDYPGSWSDSNEQPDFKESGSSPTSPRRRTLFISVRLCGNDILLGLPLPLFRGGLIMRVF